MVAVPLLAGGHGRGWHHGHPPARERPPLRVLRHAALRRKGRDTDPWYRRPAVPTALEPDPLRPRRPGADRRPGRVGAPRKATPAQPRRAHRGRDSGSAGPGEHRLSAHSRRDLHRPVQRLRRPRFRPARGGQLGSHRQPDPRRAEHAPGPCSAGGRGRQRHRWNPAARSGSSPRDAHRLEHAHRGVHRRRPLRPERHVHPAAQDERRPAGGGRSPPFARGAVRDA